MKTVPNKGSFVIDTTDIFVTFGIGTEILFEKDAVLCTERLGRDTLVQKFYK